MSLSKETVKYIADLSRIELKSEELEKLSRQLQDILDFINKLTELDITNTNPTSHILPINNVLREDTTAESLALDYVLLNAPSRKDSFFSVPKVIE
jgi:aspartyl-tRNA(Asn)/glutamyl-tRNA(Gln) amidotransferase subunit C